MPSRSFAGECNTRANDGRLPGSGTLGETKPQVRQCFGRMFANRQLLVDSPCKAHRKSRWRESIRGQSNDGLLLRPMAFLVLLTAPAGAWVVASHLLAGASLRGLAGVAGAGKLGCLQLALLLALELLLKCVDGRGSLPRGNRNLAWRCLQRGRFGGAGHRRRRRHLALKKK